MAAPIPGQRFGRLIVLRFSHTQAKNKRFACRCDCGVEVVVIGNNLTRGHSTSCGCFQREGLAQTRHGHAPMHKTGPTPTYYSWTKMKQRCLNPRSTQWRWYGARGITVCERWLIFENFLADMGERPSRKHTIDRIDNDGNYEPSNCRWSTENHRR